MKRIALLVFVVAGFSTLHAQTVKTAPKKVAPAPVPALKNLKDSASYAMGVSVANYYKQQGINSINSTVLAKAIEDILSGKKSVLDDASANACMGSFMSRMQEEKSKGSIEEGRSFLAKNKTKPGVKTTASGLQYEVIKEGNGVKPVASDSVTCNYKGTLLNGTVFDNSYERGQPVTFALTNVIPGWTEGLQLMSVGAKYKFYIPYTLGYGAGGYASIPGGAALIFEVDLLDVKKH